MLEQKIEMKYLEMLEDIDILEIPYLWPLKITAPEPKFWTLP